MSLGTLVLAHNNVTPTDGSNFPPPSELCLETGCQGRVWIYFRSVNHISQWGTVSSVGVTAYEKNVICRQLGYNTCRSSIPPVHLQTTSSPVWLTKLNCSNATGVTNILQCNYSNCEPDDDCNNHNNDLVLNCYNNGELPSHIIFSIVWLIFVVTNFMGGKTKFKTLK